MRKEIKKVTIFTICLLVITLVSSGCNPRNLPYFKQKAKEMDDLRTKQAERLIREDPEFNKTDRICRGIPLPNDFNLIAIKALSDTKGISYFYTSEVDFDTSEKHFGQYFSDNQWKDLEHSSITRVDQFANENYRVAIHYGNVGNADYSIHCVKLLSSDKQ